MLSLGYALALPLGATTTTAACGRNREKLLGQRPARRKCRPRHEADAGNRNPVLASEARLRGFHIDSRRREPWQNW
ncbi:MAG TPA: hypothetical protein DF289_02330 [Faecalibacterium sp.]|nr:hypothetical protein [Faecalibacterium sp.]